MERKPFLEHLVQRAHRHVHTVLQPFKIKLGMVRKRILHELRQVDASEQAAPARRQRFLRAGIDSRIRELFRIAQKVPPLDPVPEQRARLCIIPVRLRDSAEKLPCIDAALDDFPSRFPLIMEQILLILLHCLHEILMDPHGNIRLCHFLKICLQINKFLHIRMGTVDGDHQRSSSSVLPDQRCHKRIQFHEGNRAARLLRCIVDLRASGAQL